MAPEILHVDPRSISVGSSQPRRSFDPETIAELATSIHNHGILQPLVVHRQDAGGYELVAGERRLRAALSLGLATVPALVRDLPPERLLDVAVAENIQREDLNPLELAEAYRNLRERHQWTQQELADHIGKKRSSIANVLRYLDLPDSIQAGMRRGEISEGHVKVLLSVASPDQQLALFEEILEWKLSVRDLEDRVLRLSEAPPKPETRSVRPRTARGRGGKAPLDPQVAREEAAFADRFGTKVEIHSGRGGKGRIVLEYYSLDDYGRLRKLLLGR